MYYFSSIVVADATIHTLGAEIYSYIYKRTYRSHFVYWWVSENLYLYTARTVTVVAVSFAARATITWHTAAGHYLRTIDRAPRMGFENAYSARTSAKRAAVKWKFVHVREVYLLVEPYTLYTRAADILIVANVIIYNIYTFTPPFFRVFTWIESNFLAQKYDLVCGFFFVFTLFFSILFAVGKRDFQTERAYTYKTQKNVK